MIQFVGAFSKHNMTKAASSLLRSSIRSFMRNSVGITMRKNDLSSTTSSLIHA